MQLLSKSYGYVVNLKITQLHDYMVMLLQVKILIG